MLILAGASSAGCGQAEAAAYCCMPGDKDLDGQRIAGNVCKRQACQNALTEEVLHVFTGVRRKAIIKKELLEEGWQCFTVSLRSRS